MRIAIVKLSSLGDVIHALPVAHALHRRFHDAELTWVAEAREAPLLAGHPDLDRVLIVDTRRWRRLIRTRSGAGQVRREVGRLVGDLRAARFDVALDLQGLIKSGLLTASTRAPVRVGFALRHLREPLNALFTNRRVSPPPEAVHVVEQYLALLAPLGITDRQAVFNVPVSGEAERRVGAFLAEEGVNPDDRLVALNPGAGRPEKRWPVEHWQRLADRLALEGGVRLVIPWGPGEEGLAEALSRGLAVRPVAVPPTTLHELAALLRRVALAVAADTGPLHLAAALGTSCLGLYGPTSAARNGPYGARCRALESPGRVMATLQPDAVFRTITELLASSGSAPRDRAAGPAGVA